MISTLFQYTANTAQKMHSWKKNCHAKVIDLESDRSSSTAHVVYRKKNESIIALWRWASIYRPQSELFLPTLFEYVRCPNVVFAPYKI